MEKVCSGGEFVNTGVVPVRQLDYYHTFAKRAGGGARCLSDGTEPAPNADRQTGYLKDID